MDPLTLLDAVMLLRDQARAAGIELAVRFDFDELARVKREVRDQPPTPFFDPLINDFSPENAFWISGTHDGRVVFLQAYRLDIVDRDFPQWFATWMIGLYARTGEVLTMVRPVPIATERMRSMRGRIVYTGEFWISPKAPSKAFARSVEVVGRFSDIMAYMQFAPETIWALIDYRILVKGGALRAGKPYTDHGFVEWVRDNGETYSECVAVVSRDEIETTIRRLAPIG